MGDEEQEEDWQTKIMEDGLPHVEPELWGEEGALKRGISVGEIMDSAAVGIIVQKGQEGENIIFRRRKQTQVVYYIEDGVEKTVAYDLKIHGVLKDIPLMEASPSELHNQLQQTDDKEEMPASQRLNNVRKGGTSHINWASDDH